MVETTAIDWHRWLVYLVFGVPFLGWLFFTRNNTLRIVAVLAVQVFIQDSLAARRYLWALSVGPSLIVLYVALVACVVARRRLPPLGSVGMAWALFLLLAFTGLVIGSRTAGLDTNVLIFQKLYVEAFLFLVLGALAFVSDDEVKRFAFFFVLVGLGTALGHYFTLATGFRFRDFAQEGQSGISYIYGGFFNNPNTMGSFYSMTIPIALLFLSSGSLPAARRVLVAVSLAAMVGSLLLAVHRGGILTTSILTFVVLATRLRRPVQGIVLAAMGGVLLVASYWLVSRLMPDFTAMAWGLAEWKGTNSPRFQLWPIVLGIVLHHPLGVGLAPENLQRLVIEHGMGLASPHDLYLTIPVETGILGLAVFLYIVAAIGMQARRAWRFASRRDERWVLGTTLLAMVAFMIVGVTESVWENGEKMNHIFWLVSGITLGTSVRVLAGARARRREMEPATLLQQGQVSGI